jgi:TctA family transporter
MDLALALVVLYFSLAGAGLGTLTGLAPGVHINTVALVLVSTSPILIPIMEGCSRQVGAPEGSGPLIMVSVIVSAAVAHSFLDVLPSIFLGATEEDTVLHILPGHRLLLEGRGIDAVACSAYGSLVGAAVAVTMCLPLALVLGPPLSLFPLLDTITPILVVAALLVLVYSERGEAMAAWIKADKGTVVAGTVNLARHVPVDGAEASIIGELEKDRLNRTWVRTSYERWRVRGLRLRRGTVCIHGRWVVRRKSAHKQGCAIALIGISGLLGLTCMEARLPFSNIWEGMDQSILFPLLTGLFGLPGLIGSARGGSIPQQNTIPSSKEELNPGLRGALSGALVGWFPGISSTTGIIFSSALSRGDTDECDPSRYLTMASAVGTSSIVLGLLALTIAYAGRSGAMLAAKEVLGPDGANELSFSSPWLALLLMSVVIASALSYVATLQIGKRMARKAGGADLRRLNRTITGSIIVLVMVFCGLPGLIVLALATFLGTLPPRLGVSRVHLTGCLLIPTALFYLGLKAPLLVMF